MIFAGETEAIAYTRLGMLALAGARAVITFNSNTGVEAVLAGKPTVAIDEGSMAWPVTAHEIIDYPKEPNRLTWAGHPRYFRPRNSTNY